MKFPFLPRNAEGRIRLSGEIIFVGLAIELTTLFWNHHIAFMIHIGLGLPCVGLGLFVFLLTVATRTRLEQTEETAPE